MDYRPQGDSSQLVDRSSGKARAFNRLPGLRSASARLDGDRRDLAAHMLTDLLDLWWRKPAMNLLVANVRLHQSLVALLQTAAEFLADLKFGEAKRLLVNTASSIEIVARASGLRNDQAVQRLFKARTGLSPRWRRTANRP